MSQGGPQPARLSASEHDKEACKNASKQSSRGERKQGVSQGGPQPARLSASEHDKEACKNASKQPSRGERKQGVSQGDPRGSEGGPRVVPGGCRGSQGVSNPRWRWQEGGSAGSQG